MVINQLMENSRLMDSRLAEEDFPVSALSNNSHHHENKEEVPLLDIPFMLSSFLLSQMLVHSVISVIEATTTSSSWQLAKLASHLVSLLLWSLQFVWCAWMLNCPGLSSLRIDNAENKYIILILVLNFGEGGKIIIKRKIAGGSRQ